MKAFAKTAAVGLLWYLGFTVATNLVVRPVVRNVSAKMNVPQLGNLV